MPSSFTFVKCGWLVLVGRTALHAAWHMLKAECLCSGSEVLVACWRIMQRLWEERALAFSDMAVGHAPCVLTGR